jgi:CxxC-x17-CxxC domain-containing protein
LSSNIITDQSENRANSNGQGSGRKPSALHEAICASCGTPTMLPFAPTAERPGYCLSCYSERNTGKAKSAPTATKPARQQPVSEASPARPVTSRRAAPERSEPRDSASVRAGETDHPEVFAGLNIQARTRSALHRMGITSPTPIQEQTIPSLNEGRDVVGQAMTGSGKTRAGARARAHARTCHPGGVGYR